jgi:hypothetical protein
MEALMISFLTMGIFFIMLGTLQAYVSYVLKDSWLSLLPTVLLFALGMCQFYLYGRSKSILKKGGTQMEIRLPFRKNPAVLSVTQKPIRPSIQRAWGLIFGAMWFLVGVVLLLDSFYFPIAGWVGIGFVVCGALPAFVSSVIFLVYGVRWWKRLAKQPSR